MAQYLGARTVLNYSSLSVRLFQKWQTIVASTVHNYEVCPNMLTICNKNRLGSPWKQNITLICVLETEYATRIYFLMKSCTDLLVGSEDRVPEHPMDIFF